MFVPWVTPWIHFGFLFGFGAPWATHLDSRFANCNEYVDWTVHARNIAYEMGGRVGVYQLITWRTH